ncbi:MAG: c-type cytochrome, partial [Armatimonadetes bacterium]|nr:c-type cytochrome [Anaerolineae bacterium]
MNLKQISLLLIVLIGCLVGCTGLSGEPPMVMTRALPTPQSVAQGATIEAVSEASEPLSSNGTPDVGYPISPPDLVNGAAVYQQHCTACHGVQGLGDGALVLSGQVGNPGNFRNPQSAREQFPREWFNSITNGNLEKLMPPWKDALSEQDRWDVALYTYTMPFTPDQLALGQVLYQDCAECHGLAGRGDGPEASSIERRVPDLTNAESMVTLSDKSMYSMVVDGQGDSMPSYGDRFNEEERWAVVAYARTLMLANVDEAIMDDVEPLVTAAAMQPITPMATAVDPGIALGQTVTITGQVTNDTAGGIVPMALIVTLRAFDAETFAPLEALSLQTALTSDNTYRFEAVALEPGKVYLTAAEYQGRRFVGGLFNSDMSVFDFPIILYELTDDPSVIMVNAAITQLEIAGDTIEAQYSVRFVNTSDKLFTSRQPEPDGRYKSVSVTLPPGALVVGVANEPTYVIDDAGFTVTDTQPMQPGEERFMVVTYLLGYSDGAVIEYPMPFAVN